MRATMMATAIITASVLLGVHPSGNQSVSYGLASTATPPTPAGEPVVLVPNAQGYVRVQTEAHTIRCSVTTDLVACQSSMINWPRHPDGTRIAAVSVTTAGVLTMVDADLGELAGLITVRDGTYTADGWSLSAGDTGIEFIDQRSGHGMDLSEVGVRSF